MSKKGYRVDCHTHLWRYPGELTDELARETFIMRNKKVDLDITSDMHMAAVAGWTALSCSGCGHR